MQRPAELDLTFDIDDLAAPEPHLCGDAGRCAEMEPAEGDDRQPVDLPDRLAIGLDADRLAADLFLEPAIDAELRAHPAALWHRAWRPPMPAIKSDAIALSLAFLRSMGEQFEERTA